MLLDKAPTVMTGESCRSDPARRGSLPWRAWVAAISAAIALAGAAPSARAHAIVIASSPRQDAVVAPGATTLELDYNSRIDRMRSRATLQGPDGAIVPLSWLDGGRPTALRAQVALTAEGTYVVRWQVLSDDGHITRGTVSFRVGSTAARR